ncbi:TetR family transcriptional regulator [Micromonospora craniellae]|uniref:TetR family transcriptional regulator n=1 Tax=Micromonospora craniellae TaxID=2294034 RepID=A0A372FRI4_9ACTN|nr:TetR family transcriptional regulator [Micromonospora craniellae]
MVGHALDLFEQQGFEGTTVAQIATRAQVSEMTFFRYFASKEMVVLDDSYDPLIAEAVAGQPDTLPPLHRVTRGLHAALADMDDLEDETTRRRIRIVARTPALRAGMTRTTGATETAIADRLIAEGVPTLPARVAAAVALAALTCALLEWATAAPPTSLTDAISVALDTLEGARHD